ncbi:SUMF1/EgtB/PvdO family nonheme iron enzyme [Alcanivorax sp. S6407]|uniref:bifunctional serine/threonine-protein kinase/formylglycine-generating enzyme family protein n=1 Tax=Alcanivorax sp. S6407 TaxID=2926424 RepID=UPI001FF62F9E|nr:bifunctional serine/threonine-protein kinase/formylglycine-generating enzyme family protein [Alcanivorax sp. S6407]MCK0154918.1 SUMF1/EgtB/PvdO family nonheme iron enzyme [Alcanivorax sp. S6407]
MDKQTALQALGLADNASETDIVQAIAAKKQSIAEKQASAPTEALKTKFATMAKKLDEIEAVVTTGGTLTRGNQPVGDSPSQDKTPFPQQPSQQQSAKAPLSQTKLADLPGMAPQDAVQVELQSGHILANRYEIKELIGQGGMGAVYRAFDKNRDEDIAIKLLLPSLTKNERALERFLNEARISSKLSHPNIVNVFDVQSEGDLFFLTMELLEGQDLRQIMDNQKTAGRPFDVEDVKEYIAGITEGLAYAHQHTVHRDIKPENIWVTEDQQVKLMDFGIAQLQSSSQRTQTGAAMGTAYYMAPEQLKGVKDIDGRADQYALGVLAYEMLTEDVPAGVIEPVNALRKDIPKGMAAAIMQAMNARPENRFPDINAFNAAIQSGKAPKIPKAPKVANPHLSTGPNKLAIAAMVLLLVVGIGVAAQQGWLDALKPLDKELIAQQKADAAKLQGEIKTLKRRFDNAVRDLDRDISDAERDKNSKEEQRLQAWMDLAKRYLVDSARYGELEGLESQADLHLRDEKQSAQAVAVLEQARDGYQALIDDFYAGENVSDLSPKVGALRKQWQGKQGSKVWPVSEKVEAQYQQARANEADGLLRDAEPKLTKLADSKKLTQVTEIEALKKEEQQHRDALKAAAELVAVTGAMEGLQGQITTYKELTRSVANLAQAEKNALSAKASYEKQRKGYSLDDNASANKADEQLTAAQAALKNKQWVAAGKGFADAKAGYDSALSTESKVIASIHQARATEEAARSITDSMIKIPGGSFIMGSDSGMEAPIHSVSISSFYMQEHEVTWNQYQPCIDAGVCPDNRGDGGDNGWGKGNRPAINVSWNDIQKYIGWLNKKSGQDFRLPSEAEWEYAARAGSTGKFSWGDSTDCSHANFTDCNYHKTMPVKSYSPNGFGLYDMHGNVSEWVQDCWNDSYDGAPSDGKAWVVGSCGGRIHRGGAWNYSWIYMRLASRGGGLVSLRLSSTGFRLAKDR